MPEIPPSVPLIGELERRALQELADKHGTRWRTALFAAQRDGRLPEILDKLLGRPEAGNEIARLVIFPRSLRPVALYYGPLRFP